MYLKIYWQCQFLVTDEITTITSKQVDRKGYYSYDLSNFPAEVVALDLSMVGTSIMTYVVIVSFGYVLTKK